MEERCCSLLTFYPCLAFEFTKSVIGEPTNNNLHKKIIRTINITATSSTNVAGHSNYVISAVDKMNRPKVSEDTPVS